MSQEKEITIYTGEKCNVCRLPASHKIGEEFPVWDTTVRGHNLTGYLCEEHFNMVICPYKYKPQNLESAIENSNRLYYDEDDKIWKDGFRQGYIANILSSRASIEHLRSIVKQIIRNSQFVENSPANDYVHGKHTTANTILEEINNLWPPVIDK